MIYSIPQNGDKAPERVEVAALKDQGWSELDLQDYLFTHLKQLVGSDLMVIGQSHPGPKVDLLAVDREGDLWLFELKAVQSWSESIDSGLVEIWTAA